MNVIRFKTTFAEFCQAANITIKAFALKPRHDAIFHLQILFAFRIFFANFLPPTSSNKNLNPLPPAHSEAGSYLIG